MINKITIVTLLVALINSCGSEEQEQPSEPNSTGEPIYTEQFREVPTNPDPGGIVSKKSVAAPPTTSTTDQEIDTWGGPTVNLVTVSNPLGYRWDAKAVISTKYLPDGYTLIMVRGSDEPTECNDSNVTDSSVWNSGFYIYPDDVGVFWVRICILDNATGEYSPGKSKSYEVTE